MSDCKQPAEGIHSTCASVLVQFLSRNFIFAISILALVVYMLTYLSGTFGAPIRADGVGYYIYLPSYIIYGDPTLERAVDEQFGGDVSSWTGVQRSSETGHYIDKYGVGVAVLMLPFFLIAHAFTWCLQSPSGGEPWWHLNYALNGYSLFYQHAAGLAGLFYSIMGISILKGLLEKQFSRGIALATLSILLFGTSLLHYASGESVQSHAYSFFLFAALLWAVDRWSRQPRSWTLSAVLGLICGLIVLVRVTNLIALLIVFLYGITSVGDIRRWLHDRCERIAELALVAVITFCVFALQLAINHYGTGRWTINPYGIQNPTETFYFLSPQIIPVLFSLKRGLFFWSPLLLIVLPGLFLMWRHRSSLALAASAILLLHLWIVSSWHMWWYGGGFGHRAFVEYYAFMAFPCAAFVSSLKRRWAKIVFAGFAILTIAWLLFFMKLYYTRELSFYGLDRQALFDIFWWRGKILLNWLSIVFAGTA